MESWKMKCFPSYDPGWAAACCVLIAWILAASRQRFDLYPMHHCVCLCEVVQIRAINSMIRLSYPNISPRETLFYRISSGRHYHTSILAPSLSDSSLWLQAAECSVLCLSLHYNQASAPLLLSKGSPHTQLYLDVTMPDTRRHQNRHCFSTLEHCMLR